MRRVFRILVRVLIVLVVGMVSLLTSMRFAIHGREVQVPTLTGLTPSDAERAANNNGLLLFRENRFYSSEVPEGRILSQLPAAGTKVRSGWRVRVAESLGPQRIVIPNVIGQSPRAAEINLRRRGLEINGTASIVLPGAAADEIIAQSPNPSAQGVASPQVGILMNAPEGMKSYVMPDFRGVALVQASLAVADAGLKVVNVNTVKLDQDDNSLAAAPQRTLPEPIVTRQSPTYGQRVTPGTSVTFDVIR